VWLNRHMEGAQPAKIARVEGGEGEGEPAGVGAAVPSSPPHSVVGEAEWVILRKELLEEEKALAKAKAALAAKRQALPWTPVKDYTLLGGCG
jgi:hypothetical protein